MGLTNPLYWDCECDVDYIHLKKNGNHCRGCGSYEHEMPDSRKAEICFGYKPEGDKKMEHKDLTD